MKDRSLLVITIYVMFCISLSIAQANVFVSPPLYQKYTHIYFTKGGYVASIGEELLDESVKIALSDGHEGLSKLVFENDFVFFMKEGLVVRLIRPSYPGKIFILLVDYDIYVWTLKEVIE